MIRRDGEETREEGEVTSERTREEGGREREREARDRDREGKGERERSLENYKLYVVPNRPSKIIPVHPAAIMNM